jgi:predicted transcriptional regulator
MRRFGKLEAAVMDRLWSWGRPVAAHELLEDLPPGEYTCSASMPAVLRSLRRAGLVEQTPVNAGFVYGALLSREECVAELMADVLDGRLERSLAVSCVQRLDTAAL